MKTKKFRQKVVDWCENTEFEVIKEFEVDNNTKIYIINFVKLEKISILRVFEFSEKISLSEDKVYNLNLNQRNNYKLQLMIGEIIKETYEYAIDLMI